MDTDFGSAGKKQRFGIVDIIIICPLFDTRVVPVAGRFKTDSASGIKPVGNQELEKKSDNRPSTGFLKTGWKPVEIRFIKKLLQKTG